MKQITLMQPERLSAMSMKMAKKMPAVFFGRGNRVNVVESNAWTEAWSSFGEIDNR